MDKFLPLVVLLPLLAIFIITYILNKKTPVPPGCEDISCEGCQLVSCSHNNVHKEVK